MNTLISFVRSTLSHSVHVHVRDIIWHYYSLELVLHLCSYFFSRNELSSLRPLLHRDVSMFCWAATVSTSKSGKEYSLLFKAWNSSRFIHCPIKDMWPFIQDVSFDLCSTFKPFTAYRSSRKSNICNTAKNKYYQASFIYHRQINYYYKVPI